MKTTTTMVAGKTYRMTWTVLGCSRSAQFTCEATAKNGSARGEYTDADGKTYKRFFVKPEQSSQWSAT